MRASLRVWHRAAHARVRTVLRGTITISAGNTSATATLPYAVDPNHSELRWLGNSTSDPGTGGTGTAPTFARVEFTNQTTITAVRTGTDNSLIVGYEVIPSWPGAFRVVYRGTVSAASATSGTATVPAVDVTKASLELLGWSGGVAWAPPNYEGRISLTNNTTVTLTRDGTSFTLTAGFQIVERN